MNDNTCENYTDDIYLAITALTHIWQTPSELLADLWGALDFPEPDRIDSAVQEA